jgi:hypothetical protein
MSRFLTQAEIEESARILQETRKKNENLRQEDRRRIEEIRRLQEGIEAYQRTIREHTKMIHNRHLLDQ